MKKTSLILFLIIVLAACATTVAAQGAVTAEVTFDGSIAAGANEEFCLSISNTSNVKSVAVIPKYSENAFELIAGKWLVSGALVDFSVSEGDAVIAFSDGETLKGNLLSFTLKVKEGIQGEQLVGCEIVVHYADGSSENITAESAKAVVGCNHVYTQKILKPANDKEGGVAEYVCVVCGSSHKVILPPMKADAEIDTESNATASEPAESEASIDDESEESVVSGAVSETNSVQAYALQNTDNSDKTALMVAIVALLFSGICIFVFIKKKKRIR